MTGITMNKTQLTRSGRTLAVLTATSSAILGLPVGTPTAAAAPCPDVEVVFARGTNEPDRRSSIRSVRAWADAPSVSMR
jgi:cutinase